MKWFEDSIRNEANTRQMYLALIITFAGNFLLAVSKWTASSHSGSAALRSDALNSISDVLYSLTLIIGLLISIRPADLTHPHGHERFEPIVGLLISFSMGWAGYEAFRSAIEKLQGQIDPIEPGLPIFILIFSALIKCFMFVSIRRIARNILNKALETAAEDNLLDMLTSAAAAIGIIFSNVIHPLADPVVGLLLAIWIFRSALSAFFENINYLTGHGATQKELVELRNEISAVPGVLNVHQLFAEYVGTKLRLDVHIDLEGDMPLQKVHEIETEIENRLSAHKNIDHVFIHAEPIEEANVTSNGEIQR